MFLEPTVFVVGAGASHAYHFPLGQRLVQEVVDGLHGQPAFVQDLRDAGYSDDDVREFLSELERAAPYSIDAFLVRQKRFLDVGKACIARVLIPYENEAALRVFEPSALAQRPEDQNWVRYLVNAMFQSYERDRTWADNRVAIITFNFDRSIERIAFDMVRGSVESDSAARAMLSSILPVIHLHGQNHLASAASMDFFTVSTLTGRVLFVVVVLSHHRRRILHFNTTAHPTAEWAAQQVVEAFPDDTPRWLHRDRDRIYGAAFQRRVAGMGIAEVLSAPASPWPNPFVERVIGSIRRECLDHVIVVNEPHLRRVLTSYLRYYNDVSYCPTSLCA